MQDPLPMAIEGPVPLVRRTEGARPVSVTWRIDPRTRRVGLRGLAAARAALEAARRRQNQGRPDAA